jgi:hypothetical protein
MWLGHFQRSMIDKAASAQGEPLFYALSDAINQNRSREDNLGWAHLRQGHMMCSASLTMSVFFVVFYYENIQILNK